MTKNINHNETSFLDGGKYPSNYILINLNNLSLNYHHIKNLISKNTSITAMVKSNAYGHGMVPISLHLQKLGVESFGVFTLEEGIELRNNGISKQILIFGPLLKHQIQYLKKYRLIPVVGSRSEINAFIDADGGTKIPIHLKIDTGMGRIGFLPNEIHTLINDINENAQHVKIEGFCTHYSDAGNENPEYTKLQTELFNNTLLAINSEYKNQCSIHACNSAALIRFPEYNFTSVRPGILFYGLSPFPETQTEWSPVLSLHSYISVIKKLPKESFISYNRTYKTEKPTLVGIVPIGYADGIPLSLSNKGFVLYHGLKCQIIGNVCMNQFMIDISHIVCPLIGETVTIIGKQDNEEITTLDVASWANTIPYEILCNLSCYIPRRIEED
ncbi:MAG: alanine racemase [Caldisericia bacterium]|nr:alanine racemase [Caldisericia bacterium]